MMTEVTEYKGLMKGGPNDGNEAVASVPRIPVMNVVKFKLDGSNGDIDNLITYGEYIWDGNGFTWHLGSTEHVKEREDFI